MKVEALNMKFTERIQRFMMGRYGTDQLNIALVIGCLIIQTISILTGWGLAMIFSEACILYAIFRTFSRNIPKRYGENQVFLTYWSPWQKKINTKIHQFKERNTHVYYKCPQCKQTIRVPKGKGRIEIRCPKCHTTFVKTT